jgi:hypothetical protein
MALEMIGPMPGTNHQPNARRIAAGKLFDLVG